jgi:hypothetical protein
MSRNKMQAPINETACPKVFAMDGEETVFCRFCSMWHPPIDRATPVFLANLSQGLLQVYELGNLFRRLLAVIFA